MEKLLSGINLPGSGISRNLRSRVIQSPLAGVTDQTFRQLIRKWAPDTLIFTEMVNATSLELGHGECKVNELAAEQGPIGVQLLDHRPAPMVNAAIKAEESGAYLIDINMGCPVKKIAHKGGGSGLLKEPTLATEIVQAVVKAVSIPVTVKTRLGWCQDSSDPLGFALRLQDAGAQLLTLHGRTREQGFSGTSNWGAIGAVKQKLDIPVIANGDIKSCSDALRCIALTGADGVMIGRGSMGSPWLIGQIDAAIKGNPIMQNPEPKEIIKLILEQLNSLLEKKGDHGLLIARKHMSWTCKGFPEASCLRNALVRAQTPMEAIKLLEDKLVSFN